MLKYMLSRLGQTVVVLIGVTLLTFVLLKVAPGDPVVIMLEKRADDATIARVRHELGLDRPLYVQYFDYVFKAAQGDFGTSYFQKRPVAEMLSQGWRITFRLGLLSLAMAMTIGLIVGTVTAVWRGKWLDRLMMFCTMVGMSAPVFWLAVLMQILFGLRLGWLPISGANNPGWLVMPVVCLGVSYGASSSRLVRTSMIESISQDYVRTARAKGIDEFFVVCKHVMKNAAIPIITLIGIQLRSLISGVFTPIAASSISLSAASVVCFIRGSQASGSSALPETGIALIFSLLIMVRASARDSISSVFGSMAERALISAFICEKIICLGVYIPTKWVGT